MNKIENQVNHHRILRLLILATEGSGMGLSLDRYIRLERLWKVIPINSSIEQLQRWLCPIFAVNKQQQNLFNDLFESIIENDLSLNLLDFIEEGEKRDKENDQNKLVQDNQTNLETPINKSTTDSSDLPIESGTSDTSVQPESSTQKKSNQTQKRQALVLELDKCTDSSYIWNLVPKDGEITIKISEAFDKTVVDLKRREFSSNQTLDLPATLKATIAHGGLPKLKYEYLSQPPEYLFLIERFSRNDHRAAFLDYIFQTLRKNDIFIDRFYYDGAPNINRNEQFPGGLTLNELSHRYPNSHLIMVGSGYRLLSARTGKLVEWASPFNYWRRRTLLSTVPNKKWGYKEHFLSSIFSLFPLSVENIFTTSVEGRSHSPKDFNVQKSTTEILTIEKPAIQFLKRNFRSELLCWIATCAIYPALYFDLTIRLGKLSSQYFNSQLITAENILSITRLPWFMTGIIPVDDRKELMQFLKNEHHELYQSVLVYLQEFLQQNKPENQESTAWAEYKINLAFLKLLNDEVHDPEMLEDLQTVVKRLDRDQSWDDFVLPDSLLKEFSYFGDKKPENYNDLLDDVVPKRIAQIKKQKASKLDLSSCGLTIIPKELEECYWLEVLIISNNPDLKEISNVSELFKLKKIDFSYTQISDISPLSNLINLEDVDCSFTNTNNLTSLSNLMNLIQLNCSNTYVSDLNFLAKLANLKHINVIDTQVTDLSPLSQLIRRGIRVSWESHPNGILVKNCPLICPPIEIVKDSPQAVRDYFKELGEDGRKLNEVKVIFLGEGSAGKTSLVKRLMREDFDSKESQTHGIRIRKVPFDMNDGDRVTAHLWDFGGQEVMHATHQFFLSQRSVYVLLVTSRNDDQAVKWLKYAASFGGNSPVLVVLNKIDENPSFEVARKTLQEIYPQIKAFFRVSCKTESDRGLLDFKEALRQEIEGATTRLTPFPKNWLAIKEHFSNMQADYIGAAEYQKVCMTKKVSRQVSQDVLLQFLHDLGIVINFRNLKYFDTQILNPLWLTNGVYRILNSIKVLENDGILREADFDAVINDPRYQKSDTSERQLSYPKNKLNYIVRVMAEFELCFMLENRSYVIPQLLPMAAPDWQGEGAMLQFVIHFPDFMPDSIFPRLMVKLYAFIQDAKRWRTGMILHKLNVFKANARVRWDKEDQKIRIEVYGEERRRFLSYIRETLKEIVEGFTKLVYNELVPIPESKEFLDYEGLVEAEKAGEKELFVWQVKKKLKIADLLEGVEEAIMRDEMDQLPVKAFVSYSHKDLDSLKELRTALSPLVRLQKLQIWDDRDIDAGEEWRKEIFQQMAESDIVICLVSADFVASDFCYQTEFGAALEAHKKGEKTVIPVMLRKTDWQDLPLSEIQGVPGEWISLAKDKDEAWSEVSERIRPALAKAKQWKQEKLKKIATEAQEYDIINLVRDFINKRNTEAAINSLIKWAKENTYLQIVEDAQFLKTDLETLKQKEMLGMLTFPEANNEYTKLNNSILYLLRFQPENIMKSFYQFKKQKMLMLAANYSNENSKLNLDIEYSHIVKKLQKQSGKFNISAKKIIYFEDLKQYAENEKPSIIHFSGHSNSNIGSGVFFQNDKKNSESIVDSKSLETMFEYLIQEEQVPLSLVMLNACYSEDQAKSIAKCVPFVVGTNSEISDDTAMSFCTNFYLKLAKSDDIEKAYKSGREQALLEGNNKEHFVLYKHGVKVED